MILKEWEKLSEIETKAHKSGGARFLPADITNYELMWSLFHLDDYIVSSVTAGTIWLVPNIVFTVHCIHCGDYRTSPTEREDILSTSLLQGFQCFRCDEEVSIFYNGNRIKSFHVKDQVSQLNWS